MMIIWINGAFGSGKTQTAYELHRRLSGSYVFDPENAGFYIRDNLPASLKKYDFQDYPLWRSVNLDMLRYIADRYSGDIIIPMTVTDRNYYDELIGGLSNDYNVKHFILYADKKTILKRLSSRLEGKNSWAALQIDRCISAFDSTIPGIKLKTDDMDIYQVVDAVAKQCGLSLKPDSRRGAARLKDRLITKIRHIR